MKKRQGTGNPNRAKKRRKIKQVHVGQKTTTTTYTYNAPSAPMSSTTGPSVWNVFNDALTYSNFTSASGANLAVDAALSSSLRFFQFRGQMMNSGKAIRDATFSPSYVFNLSVNTKPLTVLNGSWLGREKLARLGASFSVIFRVMPASGLTTTPLGNLSYSASIRAWYKTDPGYTMIAIYYGSTRIPLQIHKAWRPGNGARPPWRDGGSIFYSKKYRNKSLYSF